MDTLLHDLRYALRSLTKAPGFTAIALLTMAIGTGANATVFGFLNALLLRPAPGVVDAASLVALYTSDFSSGPYGYTSYPDYLSLKADAAAFRSVAAERDIPPATVFVGDGAERIRTVAVSGEYFDVLGLQAVAGRMLGGSDVDAAAEPAAVIGYRLWQRAFEGNPAVIGKTLMVSGRVHTIVGVAPERFSGLDLGQPYEVWTPLRPSPARPDDRQNRSLSAIARLRDGVSLQQAQAELAGIAASLARTYPESNMGTLAAPGEPRPIVAIWHSRLDPTLRSNVAMIGAVIVAAVGLVLLIACANIATLLLSRGTVRQREVAIRLALGSSRLRLLRQLFTESLLLGAAGGALGLLVSMWTADILPSFFPAEQANMLDTAIDGRVVSFTACVSIAGSLLFGLAPAWQASRAAAWSILRGDSGRLSDGSHGTFLRRALVATQIAFAVVLLISAGLLVQSLVNALRADPGFGTRTAALASVELPGAEFDEAKGMAYYTTALERLRTLSGVEGATLVSTQPLDRSPRRGFRPEGYEHRPGEDRELRYFIIEGRFFDVMRIPIVAGRTFDSRDRKDGAAVAIVNDVFAQRYFNGAAVGRHITDSSNRTMEIVGVVRADARVGIEDRRGAVVYYPLAQSFRSRMTFLARTSGNPLPLLRPIRQQLIDVNRAVPIFGVKSLSSQIAEALATNRLTAGLVGACGVLALILAVVGIYGVVAYAVVRRRREIGVRIALGARRAHVLRLILGEGLGVILLGIVAGLAATVAATRVLASMLFGVSASDLSTYLAVPVILTAVSLVAVWAPARRALRVDPMTVLRQE